MTQEQINRLKFRVESLQESLDYWDNLVEMSKKRLGRVTCPDTIRYVENSIIDYTKNREECRTQLIAARQELADAEKERLEALSDLLAVAGRSLSQILQERA